MPRKLFVSDKPSAGKGAERRTQVQRTAESDTRMFEAAMALLATGGTHKLKLTDVGEAAGYSRGLANARFGTKDVFFNELILAASKQWDAIERKTISDMRGMRALIGFVESRVDLINEYKSDLHPLYVLCYEVIGSNPLARESIADFHALSRSKVERWVSEAIEDGEIAPTILPSDVVMTFYSMYFGMIYQWLVEPETVDPADTLRRHMDILLEWLALKTLNLSSEAVAKLHGIDKAHAPKAKTVRVVPSPARRSNKRH